MPPSKLTGKGAEWYRTYKTKFNIEPEAYAAYGYDTMKLALDAIKRAGGTDGQKLRDALAATKDFVGVTGKTTLDAARNATKPAVIIEVKDGKFVYKETVNP